MAALSFTGAATAAAVSHTAHLQQPLAEASSEATAAAEVDSASPQHEHSIVYVHGSVPPVQPGRDMDAAGSGNVVAATTTGPGGPTNEEIRRAVFVLGLREAFRKLWVSSVMQVWYSPLMLVCALLIDHGRRRLDEGVRLPCACKQVASSRASVQCPFFVAELIITAGCANLARYMAMLTFAFQARFVLEEFAASSSVSSTPAFTGGEEDCS